MVAMSSSKPSRTGMIKTEGPGTEGPGTEGPGTEGPGTEGPETKGLLGTEGPGTEGPETKGLLGTEGPGTEGPETKGRGTRDAGTEDAGFEGLDAEGPGTTDVGTKLEASHAGWVCSFFSSRARKPSSSTISDVLLRMKRTVDSSSSPFWRSISTRVRAGMRMES
jgi:hypothetical protein